jgi:excisionase family DNA binding protein
MAPVGKNFAANFLPEFSGVVERLLTVRQVAERLGVCAATVYKWATDGVLPHVRICGGVALPGFKEHAPRHRVLDETGARWCGEVVYRG